MDKNNELFNFSNMSERIVTAIDIGTTKIVAIAGKVNQNGKIEVLGMGKAPSLGVTRGEVINIDKTVSSINKAIAEAEAASGVKFENVHVGIAGKHIRCTQNRGFLTRPKHDEVISQNDIDRLVSDQYNVLINHGEEIIHVLPQDYLVDREYDVTSPIGMFGKQLEANFHMVIGKVDAINYIKRSVERCQLIPCNIVLEPLASAEAVLTEEEKEVGVALVDIGGGTTDIAVFYEGVIKHTAVVPFGGNVVTKDIKEGCGILEKHAEALKIKFGQALMDFAPEDKIVSIPGIKGREPKEISFQCLAGIIQSRVEEIFDAVKFEIESSGVLDLLGAGIVLTGGGALLENLPQLVAFRTGLDVRIGYPTEHIVADNIENINHTMYATAVGLLMKGLEYEAFYEEETVEEQEPTIEEPIVDKVEETQEIVSETEVPVKEKRESKPKAKKNWSPRKNVLEGFKMKLGELFDVDDDTHLGDVDEE